MRRWGVKIMVGQPTEIDDLGSESSCTLDQQLGSLQGTYLGPLYVHDRCVAWSVCGSPRTGNRICPWCMSLLFGTYFL